MKEKNNLFKNVYSKLMEKHNEKNFKKSGSIEDLLKLPEAQRGIHIKSLKNEKDKVAAILSLSEQKRGYYCEEFSGIGLSEQSKLEIIMSLNDEIKTNYINIIPKEKRVQLIMSLSEEKKEVYIDKLSQEEKLQVIMSLSENKRIKYVKDIDDRNNQRKIVESIHGKVRLLDSMREKNESIDDTIDFSLLDDKYLEFFGEDKINQMSCYPQVQSKILKLTDKELQTLGKCIDGFMNNADTEEWTNITEKILNNIGEYSELIESIENLDKVDIGRLTAILQDKNELGLRHIDQIDSKEYTKIITKKTDEVIKSEHDFIKRKAVIEKMFGHNDIVARDMIYKYGENIESLPDNEEKKYILTLKEIMECDDCDKLDEMYEQCGDTEIIDKALTERRIKTEYGKLFNEELLKIDDLEAITELGEEVYSAGTDFKMIVNGVAFSDTQTKSNYKEDWNRPSLDSQHICTSYIRNDMLMVAGNSGIYYGFNSMRNDSMMMSANMDIGSSMGKQRGIGETEMTETSMIEKYFIPDEQINNTNGQWNESDYRRVQNGEKKQPDYIVVFSKNGEIQHIEEAKKAQNEWGKSDDDKFNMPIIVVDIDKCIESESKKVDELIEQYDSKPSPDIAKEIYNKVNNNRQTLLGWEGHDKVFREDIDIEKYRKLCEKAQNEDQMHSLSMDNDQGQSLERVTAFESELSGQVYPPQDQSIYYSKAVEDDDKNVKSGENNRENMR